MRKLWLVVLVWLLCCLFIAHPVGAEDISKADLYERVTRLEEKLGDEIGEPSWMDRITISGVLEAELGFSSEDYSDPGQEDVDSSDFVLATAELGIDAEFHKHVSGHILLLFEEDGNDDNIAVDEGFISLDGADVVPLYLNTGRFYMPFGMFESHMVTDPLTLDIGETSQSALQVGFANDVIDASIAIYNGDVDETGDDEAIDSYAAGIVFSLPEDTVANLGLSAGVSYISNIGDTDGMEGWVSSLQDHVAGIGAFVSVSFKDFVALEVEYITALDDFMAGELSYSGAADLAPSALNIEVAVAPTEDVSIAVRYAATDDFIGGIAAEVLPETQYGICASYGLFESAALSAEYLMNEFENDDENSVITIQLAYEF